MLPYQGYLFLKVLYAQLWCLKTPMGHRPYMLGYEEDLYTLCVNQEVYMIETNIEHCLMVFTFSHFVCSSAIV